MKVKIFGIAIALLLVLPWAYPAIADDGGSPGKVIRPVRPGVLEMVIIHYDVDHPAKGKPGGGGGGTKVYDYYLPIGPKWDVTKYPTGIPFTINPSGAPVGAEAQVIKGFGAWDSVTGAALFGNYTIATDKWWGQLDGRNNISWQLIAGYSNAIAATWIWIQDNDNSGTYSSGDEVLENDIVFNLGRIKWGIDVDGQGTAYTIKTYDVCNIATHEVGHVVGLDDLYEIQYSEITMYGYSSKSETKKISLESGDILGVQSLY